MDLEKTIKEAARGLRKNLITTEKLLWEHLRYKQLDGSKFRRQQPIGRFVADFACLEKRLIIELDGSHHELQKERDNERDHFLKESGFLILRFQNNEIEQNIASVLERIKQYLNKSDSATLSPSPCDGGGIEGGGA